MYDARIFLNELDTARKLLADHQFVFKGEYVIHDSVYAAQDRLQDTNSGIDRVFLRLRHIPKNIWKDKAYVVALKQTELKEVGKQSIIPVKKDFDTEVEAREFIEKNYGSEFVYLYEFDRMGWQYDLGTDQIDLEEIEGYYSIEFKSKTEEGLKKLLADFNVDQSTVIVGPSVVAIKDLLKR